MMGKNLILKDSAVISLFLDFKWSTLKKNILSIASEFTSYS